MKNNVKINIRGVKGIIGSHEVSAIKKTPATIDVPAKGKLVIELINEANGTAPQLVSLKRVGKDLVLVFEDGETADVILKGYYNNEEVSLVGRAENGQYYEYVPVSGEANDYTPQLADGESSAVALGGNGHVSPDPAESNDFSWLPWVLAGLGGLAATGGAIALSNKGGNDASPSAPELNVHINKPTDEDANGRPEISGTSSAENATVKITLPDGSVITTQTDGKGGWKVEAPHSQPGGTITVTVTDQSGNQASSSIKYVDDVPPGSATITVNDDTQLAGKAEADATVTITHPTTGEKTTIAVDSNGNWAVTPNPVQKGESGVVVVVTDPSGNKSEPIYIDRPADEIIPDNETVGIIIDSITLIDDVDPITGLIADGSTTNDTRPTYSGKATTDVDSVNIYDNGALIATVDVDSNGKWSYTPDEALVEGSSHEYSVSAVCGKNEGPRVSGTEDEGWNFIIDTTGPSEDAFVAGSIDLIDDVGPVQGTIADGDVTDDSQPEYKGQISSAALQDGVKEVVIYDGGREIGRAAVDQTSGAWSFTPSAALASGEHHFTVAAVDRAGNIGKQVSGTTDESWDFSLLIGAPAAPSIERVEDTVSGNENDYAGPLQKDQATNDPTLTVSGNAAAGMTVTIMATDSAGNSRVVGTTVAGADGRWSVITDALGADGSYTLTAKATNAAGVDSPETGGFRVVLDTTAPDAASAALFDAQGDVQGVIEAGGVTDDNAPLLKGTGEAGCTVAVYLDGSSTPAGSVKVGEDGTWSLRLKTLADGQHSYQTGITDAAGNETRGDAVDFTVDTSAVEISIGQAMDNVGPITGALANGDVTDDTTPTLQGKAQAGAVVTVKDENGQVLGTVKANTAGNWSFELPEQSEGTHSWTAEVTNAAGNTSSAGFTLVIDTTAPVAPVITGMIDDVGLKQGDNTLADSDNKTDDPTPTFTGTADAGSVIKIYDNGRETGRTTANEQGEWSYTPTTNLPEGDHAITVTASDAAGNESEHSNSWDFELDVSTDMPAVTVNDDKELSGTAEAGATVTVVKADGTTTEVTAGQDGTWKMEPNPLVPGDKDVTVTATDSAGNQASIVVSGPDSVPPDNESEGVIIDSITLTDDVEPVTGLIADGSTTNDTRPTYSGQATGTIRQVNIYDNGALIATVDVDSNGKWSYTPDSDLAEGSAHEYSASAVNAYNQEGPRVSGTEDEGWNFIIDTTGPSEDAFVAGSIDLIDDVGPVQGTIADGDVTDDSQPEYKGQISSAALQDGVKEVVIYDGGREIGRAAVDQSSGAWSFTPSAALASGEHHFTVAAVDRAGNIGKQVSGTTDESWDFSLLIGAPAAPSIERVEDTVSGNENDYAGPLQKGQVTNSASLTVSGSAAAGLTVTIMATDSAGNSRVVGTSLVDENGRWSVATDALGADGSYTLTAKATNAAGAASPVTGGFGVVLDTTAPDAASAALIDARGDVTGEVEAGGVTDDNAPLLKGTGEAGCTVTVYLDGSSTPAGSVKVDRDGNWSLRLDTLADGQHSYQTKITDTAGNETLSTATAFTVDTSSISVSITHAVDNVGSITGNLGSNSVTDDTTPTLQGKTRAGMLVTVRDADGTVLGTATADQNGNWSFELPEQREGTHTWTAEVINAAGNRAQADFTLSVDTTAPSDDAFVPGSIDLIDDVGPVQGTIADGDATDDSQPEYKGMISSAALQDGVKEVVIYDDGREIGRAAVDQTSGAWSFTPSTALAGGEHHFTVAAVDHAGNVGPQVSGTADDSWDFTLLTGVPAVPVIESVTDDYSHGEDADTGPLQPGQATNDATPTLAGKAEAGMTVTVRATDSTGNSRVVGTAVADADGRWSITTDTLGADGSYTLTAKATNAAGVSSQETSGYPLVLDTTPPAAATADLIDSQGDVQGVVGAGGITDDTAPVLQGAGEAGCTVTVYLDGAAVGSTKVGTDGKWSLRLSGLSDGTHSYQTKITDAAGNETRGEAVNFTVDSSQVTISISEAIDDAGSITGALANGDVTDDTTPTLRGKAQPDALVTVKDENGLVLGTATADSNGNWSFELPEQSEGSHTWTAEVTSAAGNKTDAGFTLVIDTTPPSADVFVPGSIDLIDDVGPVQGTIADGSATDDSQPEYKGVISSAGLQDGVREVVIYDGGREIGRAAVDQTSGAWSFTPSTTLASGEHHFTVAAVDQAGNVGPQVSGTTDESWDFSLLIGAPGAPSIERVEDNVADSESDYKGPLQKGQATNDPTPTVSGSAAAGLLVTIMATDSAGNSRVVGTTVAGANGRWSVTTDALGADGSYTLTAKATNAAGVDSPETGGFGVVLDTQAPDAASAALIDSQGDVQGVVTAGGVTDDNAPLLKGTGEAGCTVAVYLDGSSTPAGSVKVGEDGTWSLQLATLSDGKHSYQTRITDAAGNETRGDVVDFTVDTSTVTVTIGHAVDNAGSITGNVVNNGVTDDTTPTLQGKAQAGAVVTVKDENGQVLGTATANANGNWSFELPEQSEGTHSWTAEVTSVAGNRAQAGFTLTIDTTAPTIPVITSLEDDVGSIQMISTTPGGVTDDPTPTFSGTADAGSVIRIYDNGRETGRTTANEQGEWSYTPTTNLPEGDHAITVTASDAAGNESEHSNSWNFELDVSTDMPAVTVNDDKELSGTAEAGATVTVVKADGTTTEVTAGQDGTWKMEPNPLVPGDKDVTVTATDSAGNQASIVVSGPDSVPPDNESEGVIIDSITLTDDVEPVTGLIADGSTTNDTRPTYSGQATGTIRQVNIYDNGALIATVDVDSNGKWSYTPDSDLAEGSAHEYSASAVNAYNQEGPRVSGTEDEGWNFIIDTTGPSEDAFVAGSIDLIDDVGPVQGTIADGDSTDDSQPEYKGQISSAALQDGVKEVVIYDGGREIGRAAVDQSSGAWSFTPSAALASGEHHFTMAAVDRAGNIGKQVSGTTDESWDFSLLIGAPAAPSIERVEDTVSGNENDYAGPLQKDQATNDPTLTVSGNAAAGMTVTIMATDSAGNSRVVGTTVAGADGRWSVITDALGADGSYTLTAKATNAAGVDSPETGGFRVVLDTTAPDAASAALFDAQGDVQGVIEAGGVTDDNAPLLKGTGEAGCTVTVYLDGSSTPAGSVKVGEDGTWSLQLKALTDGPHSYQTCITDAAGNETRGDVVDFTVDTSAVEISISQAIDDVGLITGVLANGDVTDDATPTLQGKAQAGAVVSVKDENGQVLGTATADNSGNWSFELSEQTDGTHSWTAEVTNAAGNQAQANFTLTIDTQPAELPVITSLEDDVGSIQFVSRVMGSVTDDPTPTISGTAEAGNKVVIYDNGNVLGEVVAGSDGTWSYTPTANLVEGAHSISIKAIDAAGNESEFSKAWDFLIDITPPNVGISQNSAESLGGLTEAGALVTVKTDAGQEYNVIADESGRWLITPNPLAAGEKGTIFATDPAGNQGEALSFQGAALGSYSKLLSDAIQVNTTTQGDQENPTVTRLKDGRIVVIWQGDGTNLSEVYMQMYEADGVTKVGTEQQINQRTSGNQDSPQVVALADGGFLVVWESYQGGPDKSGDGVMARRYGSDGQPLTDEFPVNINTNGNQYHPGAVALPDGGYVITWADANKGTIVQRSYAADNSPVSGEVVVSTAEGIAGAGGPEMAAFTDTAHKGMYITVWNSQKGPADNDSYGIVAQVFRADGTPVGNKFQVNTTMDRTQNYADVITLADGSFVVAWDSNDSGASGLDIRAAHYRVDPATGQVEIVGSGDFIVNNYTVGKQYKPVLVALEDGGYLIVWGADGGDGYGSAIYAQRFDANDHRVGREFLVNVSTIGNQGYGGDSVDVSHILDATLMADGNVYVSWQSDAVDNSGTGVEAVIVDVNAGYYSEFMVNSEVAGDQTSSSVAALPDGGSIVVWQSSVGDGSGSCIKAQLLDARGMPVGGEFLVNTTTTGNQENPQVTVLANGNIQVVWQSQGSAINSQSYTCTSDDNGQITGVQVSSPEITVNSGTGSNHSEPEITALADGGYMVVWQAWANNNWVVYGRQYDANGMPASPEMKLTDTAMGSLIGSWMPLPSVAQLSNGTIVFSYGISADGFDVAYRIYDPVGRTVGPQIVVNQTLANNQASPNIAALDNGNFIVTWDSNDHSGLDQNGFGVWGRVYDANGNPVTSEFLVNNQTAGDQHLARVVSRADGSFVALFTSRTDMTSGTSADFGIYLQFFDKNGNKVGQQLQVNQLIKGDQDQVDAVFVEGGQLLVTWTDHGVGDGSGTAIKSRLIDLETTLGLESAKAGGSTHIEYTPAQFDMNGTDGHDVLDARGAASVKAGGGDDTIIINSTHFTSIDGGEGTDTLVWDSNNDLELGSVSGKLSGIEVIHIGNSKAQTLVIRPEDVLEITAAEHQNESVLRITGDVGNSANGAKDTVNMDLSLWHEAEARQENGVTYDVYVNNEDTTIKLLIQHGMNVL